MQRKASSDVANLPTRHTCLLQAGIEVLEEEEKERSKETRKRYRDLEIGERGVRFRESGGIQLDIVFIRNVIEKCKMLDTTKINLTPLGRVRDRSIYKREKREREIDYSIS